MKFECACGFNTIGDLTGNTRTDRAIEIIDGIVKFSTRPRIDRRAHVLEHLLGQRALVEGFIVRIEAVLRLIRDQRRIREQRRQIQLALLRGLARQNLQKLRVPDQLGQGSRTQRGHDFAAFLRHEFEIVDHHLGQSDEIFAAQKVVLRGDAGGAVVKMADAQILAAQGNHGRRAEAETLGADQRRLDHVQSGFQSAVGLQAHAMPQLVGTQRLMRFGEPQFPRRARVLDGG